MALKRFFNDPDSDKDDSSRSERRIRTRLTSVIGEVVMMNNFKHFTTALEPMLRRVVHEEVERGLSRCTRSFARSPSLRLQALETSTLELKFSKNLSLPIFTGTKIVDQDGAPLQIILVDTMGSPVVLATLPNPIKIEIMVLDGDFPSNDRNDWTSEEFNRHIVRERTGRRPLLAGDLSTIMKGNGVTSVGDLELTDNSSWIRSRRFRIGARVSSGSNQGVRIREAMTEPFIVKDHRGELYKKHHPPSLKDEVWRLEKIGKEGAFHKKLSVAGINTVQDFLKLSVVDALRLRRILGPGMSEKMWEVTIKHARTCVMGNKSYVYRSGHESYIVVNPICQVEQAFVDGNLYSTREIPTVNRPYIENLVRQAYSNWGSLEETEVTYPNELPQLPQGDVEMYDANFRHQGPSGRGVDYHTAGVGGWHVEQAFAASPIESTYQIGYSITETSSDGELGPSSFISRSPRM
ncbi:hypothetical protein MLD38_030128 [Melastoma candidum]|uniref:Uncharacterized protein n=1 Tax=Melastoma candidum TaxID=119954 RepID=A0ACB9MPA4_9MYRT|nr:hypothetical protein MLD38_030128 [Melastoma candidum]